MSGSTIIFYLLAAITLVSAGLAVTTRQIFRAAIYLLFSLIGNLYSARSIRVRMLSFDLLGTHPSWKFIYLDVYGSTAQFDEPIYRAWESVALLVPKYPSGYPEPYLLSSCNRKVLDQSVQKVLKFNSKTEALMRVCLEMPMSMSSRRFCKKYIIGGTRESAWREAPRLFIAGEYASASL